MFFTIGYRVFIKMLNTEGPTDGPLPNVDTMGAAALGSGEQQVLLRVKSANHPIGEDLEFRANYSFTVLQVKETIQRLSNHHPEVKDQRLIYSGHLLDDGQLLREVLTVKTGTPLDPQQPVTFHLATTSKYIFSTSSNGAKNGGVNNKGEVGSQQHPLQQNHQQQQTYMFNNPFLVGGVAPPLAQYNITNQFGQFGVGGAGHSGFYPDTAALHAAYVEQMTAYVNHWNQWYM